MKKKLRFLLATLAVITAPVLSGCGSSSQQAYSVGLEIWGPFDDSTTFNQIIEQYKLINPYVGEIRYKKFSPDTYKQELIDALASGQGPDIFLINNSWLPSFENKLDPAPSPLIGDQDIRANFPDVVATDFEDKGSVYAVPLTMDSMQLFYNRDMFNAAGITTPPKTWAQFEDDVQKLTVIDSVGNIKQSGVAMGTSSNVNRGNDLLGMLMLQFGAVLPSKQAPLAKFDQGVTKNDGNVYQAGEQALGFYTQFSKLNSITGTPNPLYSWNSAQHDSVQAFAEGIVAMMFNYSWQIDVIHNRNPKLNFAVAPVPQANQGSPVTMANYWGYAVSKSKISSSAAASSASAQQSTVAPVTNDMRMHEAWQFLKYLTIKNNGKVTLYNAITKNSKDFQTNYDPAYEYLKKTNQPAARRDIIQMQQNDSTLGAFASGNLFAKSWYQVDPDAENTIFSNLIDSVNNGSSTFHDALLQATVKINHLAGSSQ